MRYTIFSFTIAFVFTIVIAATGAWAETSKSESKKAETQLKSSEEPLIALTDEPEEHFQKAHEDFLKKNAKAAANEIREGAAFLKLEAEHVTGDSKRALIVSIHELEKLADDVEKGTVKSAKDLDNAFARAEHALAEHHYMKRKESWVKNETKKAGYHLDAATHDFEHAAAWSGHKLEAGTVAVLDGARNVAGKLIEGTGWVPEKVGKAIDDLGREIGKLGKMIKPAKK